LEVGYALASVNLRYDRLEQGFLTYLQRRYMAALLMRSWLLDESF
jgi:hypothetical protein